MGANLVSVARERRAPPRPRRLDDVGRVVLETGAGIGICSASGARLAADPTDQIRPLISIQPSVLPRREQRDTHSLTRCPQPPGTSPIIQRRIATMTHAGDRCRFAQLGVFGEVGGAPITSRYLKLRVAQAQSARASRRPRERRHHSLLISPVRRPELLHFHLPVLPSPIELQLSFRHRRHSRKTWRPNTTSCPPSRPLTTPSSSLRAPSPRRPPMAYEPPLQVPRDLSHANRLRRRLLRQSTS